MEEDMIFAIIAGVVIILIIVISSAVSKKKKGQRGSSNVLDSSSDIGSIDNTRQLQNTQQNDIYASLLYYVNLDGVTFGPYNLTQLKSYPLLEDTLITTNTLGGIWYEAKYFECLDEVFNPNINLPYYINENGEIIRKETN